MRRLSESEIIQELKTIEVSPLNLEIEETVPRRKRGPDLFVDISWNDKALRFATEIQSVATPKMIASAVSQMEDPSDGTYPLIIAPYFNKQQLKDLADRNISAIDLSGNVMLIVPGELFVERIGNPNRFPSSSPIKNVYRGTSSIVGRVLLSRSTYPSVSEVFEEANSRGARITLATVSKVLKELDNDFIITRNGVIKLIDPTRLLHQLRLNYQDPRTTKRKIGKVANVQGALKKIDLNSQQTNLRYALNDPQKYVVFPTAGEPLRIYVESIAGVLEEIDFEETNRFPDIDLVETSEEPVYFDRTWDSKTKLYYTSPLQVYLDLAQGGKREQDAAAQLVDRIIAGGTKGES